MNQSELRSIRTLNILPQSIVATNMGEYGLDQAGAEQRLAVLAPFDSPALKDFEGEVSEHAGKRLLIGATSPRNAGALRKRLPWLQPQPLGLQTSAGMGDRLGLATPGHVRAVRAVDGTVAPIFAQQSIREMSRTNRTPQQVLDDATWGIFAEGWRAPVGADADHLKTPADIDACVAAGYTFFTIDPGEQVDNSAALASHSQLRAMVERLPWERLDDNLQSLTSRYRSSRVIVENQAIQLDESTLLRAAAKYGRAVAHVAMMYRHLEQVMAGKPWELEVSVDETEQPTSHAEHVYLARELKRLGVTWVSLAPRYVGRFEKGVDYIGDPTAFENDFAVHAAIAREFGPYKLSLHSGSDKFSVYEPAMRQTRGLVHLKTAGTSYLEALRTIAVVDVGLFRAIYQFARERYETDRASYHVSASLERTPAPGALRDDELPALLDQFDAREVLHVTFGSVLATFGQPLHAALTANREPYYAALERHFARHLRPFAKGHR